MRLRSIVTIGAAGEGLDAALASEADALAFTVADADGDTRKLREAAREGVARARAAAKSALVFVNHPRTHLLRDDLDALVAVGLSGVFLPHAVEPQDVRDLAVILREFEYGRGIEPGTVAAYPVIDTARGLLRARDIAQAAPRVAGLLFDGEGYAFDTGARGEENGPRFALARGEVVAAARAHEGLPMVAASALETTQLAHWGFAGILLPDASGVAAANAAFAPTAAEIGRAQAVIAGYEAARAEGAWVARIGRRVADAHTARAAHRVLRQAGLETTDAPQDADEPES
ncbi:MAG: aldolase/citrate lyase family protein [Dehalococcoidia bacterium]